MIDELLHGDDRGVSPVIGVILMVAITVILAAVIGTFVLNLGGSVQENVQAGANIECQGSDDAVKITWTSNQNADSLSLSVDDNTSSNWNDDGLLNNVGESDTYTDSSLDGNSTDVTVTAQADSTSTVISTKTCEL